ncbi:MAG: helix-turn-helix domain-containing protein, partial [Pyramidobacter sp.]|nr:helix-turn-helix domain-containing protein [Pyramidobacter sp.]
MSKISYEQKISAVELVASGVNIKEASRRSAISKTYLRQLWLRYRNGDNLRSREKTQQTYNDEFKLMVLETMRRDRLS